MVHASPFFSCNIGVNRAGRTTGRSGSLRHAHRRLLDFVFGCFQSELLDRRNINRPQGHDANAGGMVGANADRGNVEPSVALVFALCLGLGKVAWPEGVGVASGQHSVAAARRRDDTQTHVEGNATPYSDNLRFVV